MENIAYSQESVSSSSEKEKAVLDRTSVDWKNFAIELKVAYAQMETNSASKKDSFARIFKSRFATIEDALKYKSEIKDLMAECVYKPEQLANFKKILDQPMRELSKLDQYHRTLYHHKLQYVWRTFISRAYLLVSHFSF
jgi:hypothetical protein